MSCHVCSHDPQLHGAEDASELGDGNPGRRLLSGEFRMPANCVIIRKATLAPAQSRKLELCKAKAKTPAQSGAWKAFFGES